MNMPAHDRLYGLLPAIYRLRDAEQGEPLRALLAVIEAEFDAVQNDIDALYENWFIETCAEWVVPYIGDLLRVEGVQAAPTATFSQRAQVANTMRYRRRKGTAAVLEQLARDVSGWPARAVEFFQLLETTQHLNHVRIGNVRTPDLRDADRLDLVGGPFDPAAHTVDVRHIDNGRGRYNIPNVGLFLWRLQSYAVADSDARRVGAPADGRFRFDPTGLDAPLFNRPQTETEITHLAGEENVPGVLRRRPLHDELEALRRAAVDGGDARPTYFGAQPVLRVRSDEAPAGLPPEQIEVCDLSLWRRPITPRTYHRASDHQAVELPIAVAVDPVLGRLTFPVDNVHENPRVSFSYGFSGDLGGGPYNRLDSVRIWHDVSARPVTFQRGVTKDAATIADAPDTGSIVDSVAAAVADWHAHAATRAGAYGVIAIMDSRTYEEELAGADGRIRVPAGSRLAIVAAGWTITEDQETGEQARVLGHLAPQGLRPHLRGNVEVAGLGGGSPGELIIDGLLIEGKLTVAEGDLGGLRILHSTLVPDRGGLAVRPATNPAEQNAHLAVTMERSISGPIVLPATVPRLELADGVIDPAGAGEPGGPPVAITAPGASADLRAATILGTCSTRTMYASNCVFVEQVDVERRQTGCVRFSHVPVGSTVPRRHRCQPADEALADRVLPQFSSVTYGAPTYAQLASACPLEITRGADDEQEMGAWHFLGQSFRVEALRASLDEYLRVGLEAGLFFAT
jgi:hypothetical protein